MPYSDRSERFQWMCARVCAKGEYELESAVTSTDPSVASMQQMLSVQQSSAAVTPSLPHANMRETCHIAIPNYAVGAIIGAAGANIKRIIRDSNAFVTVCVHFISTQLTSLCRYSAIFNSV